MKKIFIISTLILTGCGTVSNVLPVGPNTYRVSSEMIGAGIPSWSDVKDLCINAGNEYCLALGKVMREGEWETHGVRGWTPMNGELTFQCVEPDPI